MDTFISESSICKRTTMMEIWKEKKKNISLNMVNASWLFDHNICGIEHSWYVMCWLIFTSDEITKQFFSIQIVW